MSLEARQKQLIDDLNHLPDAHERLAALTSFVREVMLPDSEKRDELLVPGCVSRVWLDGGLEPHGVLRYRCAADSPMVAGLVALLCHLYTGVAPEEVLTVEPEVLQACGLTKVLSPTRMNGLHAVRQRIRAIAAA